MCPRRSATTLSTSPRRRGRARSVTRVLAPKLAAYVALAAAGLVAALAVRLQELVVLAAPFAVLPIVSLLLERRPRIDVAVELERERALEGEELQVKVRL